MSFFTLIQKRPSQSFLRASSLNSRWNRRSGEEKDEEEDEEVGWVWVSAGDSIKRDLILQGISREFRDISDSPDPGG